MVGSELGGDLVKGVCKTLKNGEAQTIYIDEVRGKVRDVNVAIVQAKARCNREGAEAILRRITEKGEDGHGLSKDDLVFLRTGGSSASAASRSSATIGWLDPMRPGLVTSIYRTTSTATSSRRVESPSIVPRMLTISERSYRTGTCGVGIGIS